MAFGWNQRRLPFVIKYCQVQGYILVSPMWHSFLTGCPGECRQLSPKQWQCLLATLSAWQSGPCLLFCQRLGWYTGWQLQRKLAQAPLRAGRAV